MTISRWGSQLTRMLGIADGKPMHPPQRAHEGDLHFERGDDEPRWWVYTGNTWVSTQPTPREVAAFEVSQKAREVDSMERIADQLARALGRALKKSMSHEELLLVTVTPDQMRYSYRVELSSSFSREALAGFEVPDEVIARNTTSTAVFHEWIMVLGEGLARAAGFERKPPKPGEWIKTPLLGRERRVEHFDPQKLVEACMAAGAVIDESILDEESAIQSILRTMNERPDL